MNKPIAISLTAAGILFVMTLEASAQSATAEIAPPGDPNFPISVQLISATTAVGNGDSVQFGLRFKMQPGWRIYWNNPTGFSFHPRLDTKNSENLEKTQISWPPPTRIPVYGHQTLGYRNEVVLPVVARLTNRDAPLHFRAELKYLACSDYCIPVDTKLNTSLPAGAAAFSEHANLIERYARLVPVPAAEADVTFAPVRAGLSPETTLRVVAQSSAPFRNPDLVVGGPEYAEFTNASVALGGDRRQVTFDVPAKVIPAERLQGKPLTLILLDEGRIVSQRIVVSNEPLAQGFWSRFWRVAHGFLSTKK